MKESLKETFKVISFPNGAEMKPYSGSKEVIHASNYAIWVMLAIYGATFLRNNLPTIQRKKEPELRDLYSQLALLVVDPQNIKSIRGKIKNLNEYEKKDFLISQIVAARAKADIEKRNRESEELENKERERWVKSRFDGNRLD
jgi:hypothetical protein